MTRDTLTRTVTVSTAVAEVARDPVVCACRQVTESAIRAEVRAGADVPALKQRLAALVGRHFAPDLATRALAMAERYVDYRVALGQLRAPADLNDPRALRSALAEREQLRRQHFQDEEYEALFAH